MASVNNLNSKDSFRNRKYDRIALHCFIGRLNCKISCPPLLTHLPAGSHAERMLDSKKYCFFYDVPLFNLKVKNYSFSDISGNETRKEFCCLQLIVLTLYCWCTNISACLKSAQHTRPHAYTCAQIRTHGRTHAPHYFQVFIQTVTRKWLWVNVCCYYYIV